MIAAAVALWLFGSGQRVSAVLTDKTLVAWATPDNLTQRGGSVLTIEGPGGVFDGIVFGELSPGTWMAGSEFYHRTSTDQSGFPKEASVLNTPVEIAIVYRGKHVELYRDGKFCSGYDVREPASFGASSRVIIGLRHSSAARPNRAFSGSIEEVRIYPKALSADEIGHLTLHRVDAQTPLARWDFTEGSVTDRMGRFPATRLVGKARIANGKLVLGEDEGYLVASAEDSMAHDLDSPEFAGDVRTFREKLLTDPYRPGYHFAIPEGTAMPFDPDGAIYWKGRYHLFYIFQDKRGHNWGHISSTDLFHWRHHPTGLISGMFSGNCFINKDGRPTMCYHQVDQGNAMAVALDDELNTWKKLDSNPITPKTAPGDPMHDRYRSWDPYCWSEGDHYYAIFGGNHPAIAKAPKLSGEWKYVGDLMANAVPGVSMDEDVSCADFFKLGNKMMLLCISHRLGCRYYLGEWKGEQFHPEFHEQMSWVDNSFFAPRSLVDDRGRRIMWSWIFDKPGFGQRTDGGWSGTMSLPRVLSLDKGGRLTMAPPEEIERLRYNAVQPRSMTIASDDDVRVDGMGGRSVEIDCTLESRQAKQFGIRVCCSPDGAEQTSVYYDAVEHKLKVDTTLSSQGDTPRTVESGPLTLRPGEPLKLRVFVDNSVVEVFANNRQAVMRRIYPSRADSIGVRAFSLGGGCSVKSIRAWDMMPSNPY